jgi:hypothetical protein
MSPEEMDRVSHVAARAAEQAAQRAHEKSRLLSAEAVDAALPLADASWLNAHLRACPACRAVDDEYRAIHAELRSLPTPEPPRDLWARTSAGLDSVDRTAAQRSASPFGFLSARRTMVGSAAAAGLAIVVVGAVVLTGTLGSGGSSPAATGALAVASPAPSAAGQAEPLTVVDGTTYWVAPVNGLYQITGGSTRCTGTAANCAVTNGNGTLLGSIASTSSVSVVIAPGAKQAAVWTADKIVVLPLTATAPKTVSLDLLTPRPAASTAAATAAPAGTAAQPSSASSEPDVSGLATTPAPSAVTTAAATPHATPPVSGAAQPTAILDGYKIVGRDPQFSPDGQWIAFSARPSDLKSGSDVFIWRTGWDSARAITTNHMDLFAGWFGKSVLVSEFVPVVGPVPTAGSNLKPASPMTAISYIYDPANASIGRIDRPMLLPVADPSNRYLVYWSGTVRFNAATGLWEAGQGDLYFESWSSLVVVTAEFGDAPAPAPVPPAADTTLVPADTDSATPTPTVAPAPPPSGTVLPVAKAAGSVRNWTIRWDGAGSHVAVWVADSGSTSVGLVAVFAFDPSTGQILPGQLMRARAVANIQFDGASLIYTSPSAAQGGDGETYMWRVPAPATPTPVPSIATPVPTPTPQPTPEAPAVTASPEPVPPAS